MNILVTGGCGFIGSNFINYILKKHNHVKIFNIDCLNYCANETNVINNPTGQGVTNHTISPAAVQ